MTFLTSILTWIFTGSIFGPMIIAIIIFVIALGLGALIPKIPDPGILAGIAFILALMTLPSVPRYKFEKTTLSNISGKPWIRVIRETRWGAITEPLTWFNAPVGSFFLVMPESPELGGFREVSIRYEDESHIYHADPDCEQHVVQRSKADNEGMLRYSTDKPEKMSDSEATTYCTYDWTNEKAALAKAMLASTPRK